MAVFQTLVGALFVAVPIIVILGTLRSAVALVANRCAGCADTLGLTSPTLRRLAGGDRRSLEGAHHVAEAVIRNPACFDDLFAGLRHHDATLRMRCAYVIDVVSARHPTWLRPYTDALLDIAEATTQYDVRWRLADMITRLALNEAQHTRARAILESWLGTRNGVVGDHALKALQALAKGQRQAS